MVSFNDFEMSSQHYNPKYWWCCWIPPACDACQLLILPEESRIHTPGSSSSPHLNSMIQTPLIQKLGQPHYKRTAVYNKTLLSALNWPDTYTECTRLSISRCSDGFCPSTAAVALWTTSTSEKLFSHWNKSKETEMRQKGDKHRTFTHSKLKIKVFFFYYQDVMNEWNWKQLILSFLRPGLLSIYWFPWSF